jgi:hypothetical protein
VDVNEADVTIDEVDARGTTTRTFRIRGQRVTRRMYWAWLLIFGGWILTVLGPICLIPFSVGIVLWWLERRAQKRAG